MQKIILKIDGMMCGMCETHINDAIRKSFTIKKVTSSHSKNKTEIITVDDIDENELRKVIDATGYKVVSIEKFLMKRKVFLHLFVNKKTV